ncbi:MAG: hypothetical protein HQK52_19455 [Oligoflexia bacterium]|nr:hypothetical protein [Oligoflexia bacterium]
MRSQPRVFFGVHSFTPYNAKTGEFYGTVEALKGSSFSLSGELVELTGGSSKFPFAIADSSISAELSFKPCEYPDFLFELFLGKKPTDKKNIGGLVGDINGSIKGKINITVLKKEDVKFGKYFVKAIKKDDLLLDHEVIVSGMAFQLSVSSSVDFSQGDDATFVNDSLLIDFKKTGLKIEKGAVDGLVDGDSGFFDVWPPSDQGSIEVTVGASGDVFPEFGAIIMGQKSGGGDLIEIDVFRLKGIGLPLGFEEKKFSESEIKAKAMYDANKNGICKVRYLKR